MQNQESEFPLQMKVTSDKSVSGEGDFECVNARELFYRESDGSQVGVICELIVDTLLFFCIF